MSYRERILELARKNHGMVTTAMLNEAGIARTYLKVLVDMSLLEKSSRGIYVLPEIIDDEFVKYQTQFKKGIYSKETALFLHDLTDRTPNIFYMTFPDNYNLTNVKNEGIHPNRSKEPYYSLGIVEVNSPSGHIVRIYDMEKTLCDILNTKSYVETEVIKDAFKRYIARKDKNIPKLSKYAKILKVDKKLRNYLELLM